MANSFQKRHEDVNHLGIMAAVKMNNRKNWVCITRQEILIRDQNLKDNIMAVQRRIPR